MKTEEKGLLLRVFLGESDRHRGQPLADTIVRRAREAGLAGATVLRGTLGYGAKSRIHSGSLLRLSEDLPLVLEIVDEEEKVRAFLPVIDELVGEGLVTLERVDIVLYRHGRNS
jgi:PII-like signaling protein